MDNPTPPSPSEGVKKYIDRANQALATRKLDIARARKRRFDTIAVHGLYTATEAIEKNQGAIIEPVFASSGQVYRDSDEMEAAQTGQIPTWAYIRIHNPTLGYLEDTLALLETYGTDVDAGCVVYSSGMAAIENLTDTLLVKQGNDPINFVAHARFTAAHSSSSTSVRCRSAASRCAGFSTPTTSTSGDLRLTRIPGFSTANCRPIPA